MSNISGFGYVLNLIASQTFPSGFVISQGSNDSDPLDMPSVTIGDMVLGVNGDPISWNKAVTLDVTIAVIPGGLDDQNLQILANANRVSQGKQNVQDVLTLSAVYPDGSISSLTQGAITGAPFLKSISSDGRIKTRSYSFKFANFA